MLRAKTSTKNPTKAFVVTQKNLYKRRIESRFGSWKCFLRGASIPGKKELRKLCVKVD